MSQKHSKPVGKDPRTLHCAQRGCTFEVVGDADPEHCPTCGHPFAPQAPEASAALVE